MNIQAKRESIIKRVKKISDAKALSYIDGILSGVEFSQTEKPMTRTELMGRIGKAEEDARKNKMKPVSQLRKELKNW